MDALFSVLAFLIDGIVGVWNDLMTWAEKPATNGIVVVAVVALYLRTSEITKQIENLKKVVWRGETPPW